MDDDAQRCREILQLSADLQVRVKQSGHRDGDARTAFLVNTVSALATWGTSLVFERASRQLYGQPVDDEYIRIAVERFGSHGHGTRELTFYRAKQRAHLFLDVWGAFEDPLRILYGELIARDVQEQDRLEGHGHISIPTVWARVSKLAAQAQSPSKENMRALRETVEFWSAARNTVHSNTLYQGSAPKALVLRKGAAPVELVPGQHYKFMTPWNMIPLIELLVEAWELLREGLKSHPFISTPTQNLKSPYD